MKWLVLLLLSGCTWFDDDPPKPTCKQTSDCFAGQEVCENNVCVPVDAGPP